MRLELLPCLSHDSSVQGRLSALTLITQQRLTLHHTCNDVLLHHICSDWLLDRVCTDMLATSSCFFDAVLKLCSRPTTGKPCATVTLCKCDPCTLLFCWKDAIHCYFRGLVCISVTRNRLAALKRGRAAIDAKAL